MVIGEEPDKEGSEESQMDTVLAVLPTLPLKMISQMERTFDFQALKRCLRSLSIMRP